MGKYISKYVTSLVDILHNGIEIVTPKAGFLEDLFSSATYKAKARIVDVKVKSRLFDLVEGSQTMRELNQALENAETAALDINKSREEAEKKLNEKQAQLEKEIADKKKALDEELLERQTAFNKEMEKLKGEFEFNKEMELAKLDRQKAILEGELKFKDLSAKTNIDYTNQLIAQEQAIFEKEVERLTAQFEKDSKAKEAALQKELESKLTIANAEIARLKAEAEIAYSYDIGVVEKKVYAECYDKLSQLQNALAEAGLKDELIVRLESEVEYFRSRMEADRATVNSYGAKALDSALAVSEKSVDAFGKNLGRETKPVTVNVDAKSIGKKQKD